MVLIAENDECDARCVVMVITIITLHAIPPIPNNIIHLKYSVGTPKQNKILLLFIIAILNCNINIERIKTARIFESD